MRLYAGSSSQFIKEATQNEIAKKLKESFHNHYRFNPSDSEINSWENSLHAVGSLFKDAGMNDHGVILEYQLPLTSKRLDVLVCGEDDAGKEQAVIVELKQWGKCDESESPNVVETYVGGSVREVLHPSVQVGQYRSYLEDTHTAFHEGPSPISVSACSYLHNYKFINNDPLCASKFSESVKINPVFSSDCDDHLKSFLMTRMGKGNGEKVLEKIENSKYKPSKKLMQHVSQVIKGKSEYILLDEQLVVYDKVFSCAKKSLDNTNNKSVIIIKGGPGTGKSVIAINLMADLLAQNFNAQYATGSRAFTETLRAAIGRRGGVQCKYFNSYMNAEENVVDVLIADEAHRIRTSSNNRFTPKTKRSDQAQIDELISASRVSVFFIDDRQIVRPNEIGSVDYIKEAAEARDCDVFEYELEAQFRCNGSDAFVNWVNNTVGIKKTANVIWDRHEEFDFKIFGSPEELEAAIIDKNNQGLTARMTAGFCWDWSKKVKPDGTLYNDVEIGSYSRPWNARPEATRLAANIPKASLWAYDPNGINQIGCIYTAQGFEFDYVGIIWGMDLRYNLDTQSWEAFKNESFDTVVKRSGDKFIDLVKNTYRVLLSRGMKGCYVHFMDKDTERFFKTRIE